MKTLLKKIASFFLVLLIIASVVNIAFACTLQGVAAFGLLMISMIGATVFAIILADLNPKL